MSHRRSALASLAVLALVAAGCSGGSDGGPPPPPVGTVDCQAGSATLEGAFTAPNGTTPVGGATVSLSTAACTATTNALGQFKFLNVPAVATEVTAAKGNFSASAVATPGSTPVVLTIAADTVNLAYVAGAFDSIQTILQGLGFAPVQLVETDLATVNLAAYDALFLNCGMDDFYAFDDATVHAVRDYVDAGGTLYASDWSYIFVLRAFPARVNMLGEEPTLGEATEVPVTAQVLDPALQAALGKSTASIMFDLGAWAVIDSAPAGTEVLISGPVTWYDWDTGAPHSATKPYAVRFQSGYGRVTYTSFHNEAQATADMQRLLESMVFGL